MFSRACGGSSRASLRPDLLAQMQAYQAQGHLPLATQNRREVVNAMIAQHPDLEASLINLPEVRAAVMTHVGAPEFQTPLKRTCGR